MTESTAYQCNVQADDGGENYGCMKVFESKGILAPADRLCPTCKKAKETPRQKARED